jgi:hypothetical protein
VPSARCYIVPMAYIGRHTSATAASAPGVSVLLAIVAVPAFAGLSIYALLFMFNAVEKLSVAVCGGMAILGGLVVIASRGRKISIVLTSLPAAVLPLLPHFLGQHHPSLPAPVIFALVECAVVFAAFIGGLIIGAMVFLRESRDLPAQ